MILTHIRTENWMRDSIHARLSLIDNVLSLTYGGEVTSITLSVSDIRSRFGNGNLYLVVQRKTTDDKFNIHVCTETVNPGQIYADTKANLLFAEIPAGAKSWMDPGVRIITREVASTENLDRPMTDIQIFHNELFDSNDAEQLDQWSKYTLNGNNPFKKGFLFLGQVKIYEKKI